MSALRADAAIQQITSQSSAQKADYIHRLSAAEGGHKLGASRTAPSSHSSAHSAVHASGSRAAFEVDGHPPPLMHGDSEELSHTGDEALVVTRLQVNDFPI